MLVCVAYCPPSEASWLGVPRVPTVDMLAFVADALKTNTSRVVHADTSVAYSMADSSFDPTTDYLSAAIVLADLLVVLAQKASPLRDPPPLGQLVDSLTFVLQVDRTQYSSVGLHTLWYEGRGEVEIVIRVVVPKVERCHSCKVS